LLPVRGRSDAMLGVELQRVAAGGRKFEPEGLDPMRHPAEEGRIAHESVEQAAGADGLDAEHRRQEGGVDQHR